MSLTLGALKSRDFRVLWIGSTVSNIGTWMHIVAQGWLMYLLTEMVSTLLQTHTPTELRGRVMSVYTISWQGLEYVGVLLTGGLAALVSTSLVVFGAAVIVGALIVTVQASHRSALQAQ